nr:MAG TPA: hypothetical protein [Bacteriophage sp.]
MSLTQIGYRVKPSVSIGSNRRTAFAISGERSCMFSFPPFLFWLTLPTAKAWGFSFLRPLRHSGVLHSLHERIGSGVSRPTS